MVFLFQGSFILMKVVPLGKVELLFDAELTDHIGAHGAQDTGDKEPPGKVKQPGGTGHCDRDEIFQERQREPQTGRGVSEQGAVVILSIGEAAFGQLLPGLRV